MLLHRALRHPATRAGRARLAHQLWGSTLAANASASDAAPSTLKASAADAKDVSKPKPPRPSTTWDRLVVGEIVQVAPHPQADRLSVCQVNVGDPENAVQIICGAPNVREGVHVVVAQVGSRLAIQDTQSSDETTLKMLKIKKSKLRGEISQGMICSEAELGLTAQSDGIWILNDETFVPVDDLPAPGTPVLQWPFLAQRLVPATTNGSDD